MNRHAPLSLGILEALRSRMIATLCVACSACQREAPQLDQTKRAHGTDQPVPAPSVPPSARRNVYGVCPGNEVDECMARYSRSQLAPTDIKRFVTTGLGDCFAQRNASKLADQGACLPLSLGTDARNGRALMVSYSCSDLCPNYGRIVIVYANTKDAECCGIGGYPLIDPGWGATIGCSPAEVPMPINNAAMRRPDGTVVYGTRSPCDPWKIKLDDGTIVEDSILDDR